MIRWPKTRRSSAWRRASRTWTRHTTVRGALPSPHAHTPFPSVDPSGGADFNQAGVGRALKTVPRSSYFLTTKVEPATDLASAYNFTAGRLAEDLSLLAMDSVDLMLLHNVVPGADSCAIQQEQWRALEDFHRAGKARAIGVSNYCAPSLACLLKVATFPPAVNQVQYHIGMGRDPSGLMSFCKANGIVLEAYGPLASDHGPSSLITGNLTNGIGKAHNKSGAQVALKWLAQRDVPLITTSLKPAYLAEDMDVYSDWELTEAELSNLDAQTAPVGTICHPPE